jgi:hypothetical protein
MRRLSFDLRDVFWLTLLMAMGCAWLWAALALLMGLIAGAVNGLDGLKG